jgi:hypothetical protein
MKPFSAATEMVLEVIEQNEPAVRLYQRSGFQTVAVNRLHPHGFGTQAKEHVAEIDLREISRLIAQHGLTDLPWQISSEYCPDESACADMKRSRISSSQIPF